MIRALVTRDIVAVVAGKHVDDARAVVAAHHVHQRVEEGLRVILVERGKILFNRAGILPAHQEGNQRLAQRIVHHAVERIAEHIGAHRAVGNLVAGVLPHLAEHSRLRINGLDLAAQLAQELHRQLIRHVKAPAAGALTHPVLHHGVFAAQDILAEILVHFIDVGQRAEAPPALVVVRPVFEGEPLLVRGFRVAVRADLFAVRAAAVEIYAVAAHVGKHAVEHNADAHRLRFLAELAQLLFIAEHRVDLHIVARVVFMVGSRGKDRVEVDHAHAHILQIGQLLADALKVAAEEVVREVIAVVRYVQPRHLVPVFMALDLFIHVILGVHQRVRALAMEETVHHDLIHHAVVHPFRRLIRRVVHGDLEIDRAAHTPLAAAGIIRRAKRMQHAVRGDLKAIPEQAGLVAHLDLRLIIALALPCAERAHRVILLRPVPCTQLYAVRLAAVNHGDAQAYLRPCGQRPLREAIKRVSGVMRENHGNTPSIISCAAPSSENSLKRRAPGFLSVIRSML